MTAEVGIQAHGLATHLALITILKLGASYEGLKKTKHDLFALSLKNIPGEKIPDINLKIKTFVDQLECARELHSEHVLKIVSIYETCTEPQFLQ